MITRSSRGATLIATALVLASCGGAEIGPEHARTYFTENRAGFERIVEEIERCRPETGKIDRRDHFRCSVAGADSRHLVDAMNAARAQWIRVDYADFSAEDSAITKVLIATHSHGTSFAGRIEAFIFEATPKADAEVEIKDDGIAIIERMPVTEGPHHWYWWRITR